MKRYVFFVLVLLSSIAAAQHHNFIENDWTRAINVSKATLRPIFVFATIKGCRSCIEMEREIFSDTLVQRFLNHNFVSLRINGQVGQGQLFAKANHIVFYPTIIFFDSAQHVIRKTGFSLTKNEFLNSCRLALDPSTRTPALTKQFETQKNDTSFLKRYISVLADEQSNTGPAIDSLFKLKGFAINFETVQYLNSLNSCKSELLDHVIKNRSKYNVIADVASHIEGVFYNATERLFTFGYFSESEYRALKQQIGMAKIFGWQERLGELEKLLSKHKK